MALSVFRSYPAAASDQYNIKRGSCAIMTPSLSSPSSFSVRYLRSMAIVAVVMAATLIVAFEGTTKNAHAAVTASCNCVVFRLDDVQDRWIHDVQLAALDTFIKTNTKVTPGLVMNFYGADSAIVNKVQQGKNASLFELALHGGNHVDYATLSRADQEKTLTDANTKLNTIHGQKSNIFIAPYNSLNQNTLTAMRDANLQILSADLVADGSPPFLPQTFPPADAASGIKSLPMTVDFIDRAKPAGSNGKSSEQLTSAINASITTRGWAVVMIHPQNFATYDSRGVVQNTVNATQMTTLKNLIAQLNSDGRTVTDFNGLVTAIGNQPPSPDTTKPRGAITSPAPESALQTNTPVTVTGMASDNVAVASVEVRAANSAGTRGTTYAQATTSDGFAHWTFNGLVIPSATYDTIVARITDTSGNQQWLRVAVTVT